MIGEAARAMSPIGPGAPGRVAAHGEIWTASAAETVAEGEEVVIVAVEGLTLRVGRKCPAVYPPLS
jgi:membrane-bound ClpP family serine protease